MIETRRLALDVRYNSYPFAGQVGGDIESLTYTDSAAAGGEAGQAITLNKAPLYVSSTAKNKAGTKTGTYWLYDGILINGRYRVTNSAARCGKLPVGQNVTGWVPASYCIASEEAKK